MKKLLCAVLTAAMLVMLFTGCSLFTAGGDDGNSGGNSAGDIQVTDNYTYTDPAGLDFDTRYVIYNDRTTEWVAWSIEEFGQIAIYTIIYAKDDNVVGSYEISTFDNTDGAQEYAQMYVDMGIGGRTLDEDPTVVFHEDDANTIEVNLANAVAWGHISEMSASAYVDYLVDFMEGKLI